jgi:hypothetical protein
MSFGAKAMFRSLESLDPSSALLDTRTVPLLPPSRGKSFDASFDFKSGFPFSPLELFPALCRRKTTTPTPSRPTAANAPKIAARDDDALEGATSPASEASSESEVPCKVGTVVGGDDTCGEINSPVFSRVGRIIGKEVGTTDGSGISSTTGCTVGEAVDECIETVLNGKNAAEESPYTDLQADTKRVQ